MEGRRDREDGRDERKKRGGIEVKKRGGRVKVEEWRREEDGVRGGVEEEEGEREGEGVKGEEEEKERVEERGAVGRRSVWVMGRVVEMRVDYAPDDRRFELKLSKSCCYDSSFWIRTEIKCLNFVISHYYCHC